MLRRCLCCLAALICDQGTKYDGHLWLRHYVDGPIAATDVSIAPSIVSVVARTD